MRILAFIAPGLLSNCPRFAGTTCQLTPTRSEITNASYCDSSPMAYEQFEVEPHSGWRDPLETHYASLNGFAGGGLSGLSVLSPTPTVLHLDLNGPVRFDQPGVVVTSHRAHDSRDTGILHRSELDLKSNPIHIHIVPADAAWQKAKFDAILETLSAHPATLGMQPPAREAAVADMRYLANPQAIQWLAQHLREDEPTTLYRCSGKYPLM